MEQAALGYRVRLEQFEGPLDLLLHLIKTSEVNIYDIPIALITQQYLEYLSVMKSFNLTVAGEFLVMAATLVQIKSRMLLPKDEAQPEEEDGLDPREALVRRLLEYTRYKEAANHLEHRERLWREIFGRSEAPSVRAVSDEPILQEVSLFDLVDALQGVLARTPDRRLLEIEPDTMTVRDRMSAILDVLEHQESVTFRSLFEGQEHRVLIIVTFLALLELVRQRLVRLFQGEAFGSILMFRAFSVIDGEAPLDQ